MYDNRFSWTGRATVSLLIVGMVATTLTACGGDGMTSASSMMSTTGTSTTTTTTTSPSTISLASPGQSVNRTVTLTATPVAGMGVTLTKVTFMVDGASIGTSSTSPYTAQWDTTTVTDGTHSLTATVTDSAGQMATSTAVSVTVLNNPTLNVALSPAEIYPAPTLTASGAASVTVDLATGAVKGKVQLAGVTATGVTLNSGFAGATGASVVTLTHNATIANEWDLPASAMLTAEQVTTLQQGGFYIQAVSAANPNGAARGQLTLSNITVTWATLAGSQEVTPVTTTATGTAAVTVDSVANTVTVYLNTTGVTDATGAEVDTGAKGAAGTKLVALTQSTTAPGTWSVMLSPIAATDVTNFNSGMWYVNLLTATDTMGLIRGQVTVPSATATPTLTQLQVSIFTPLCSGCHDGVGTVPPAALNLAAGGTYAATVNVATGEQPALKYIVPADPNDSYLVQKLLGASTISGVRMPEGGPYLDTATIAEVQAWITAGALNN